MWGRQTPGRQMQTPRLVPNQRRGNMYTEKHDTEVEEGNKHGEKDTNTGLHEGRTEPQEREREIGRDLETIPPQQGPGFYHIQHPLPTGLLYPSCR